MLALFSALSAALVPASAQPRLGDAPRAPPDVSGLPGGNRAKLSMVGAFLVDPASREEVRSFYNAVYPSSDLVSMDSSADVGACVAGTNSTIFQRAVLWRINWFRAMAGVPAAVTLDATEGGYDQAAALIMAANNTLSHFPAPTWTCYTGDGAHAASNSDIALGWAGASAITRYIWDAGSNNSMAGHRRWLLYPQTQVMGTGDVPSQGALSAANATWVFDANLFQTRPPTRQPGVAWPPAGYVPYQVIFPQWSFALSNADFSAASVTMTSNGEDVAVSLQPYEADYGENTLVWVPLGLDYTSFNTTFPFSGADTVYSVTVTNIKVGAVITGCTYAVTAFDPAVPGADYIAPAISGSADPSVQATNSYTCVPADNSSVTSYQWRVAQRAPGNLFDGAEAGLANFSAATSPGYSVITNTIGESGSHCFYLAHPELEPQFLELGELLFPAANAVVSFKSKLGYATTAEIARLQVSVDDGSTWQDVYTQAGSSGAGEASFTTRTASLANCAGRSTRLRFNYDGIAGLPFYGETDPAHAGWCIDNILVTNTAQLVNLTTNTTASTNFTFIPAQTGPYTLQARAVIFTRFPLGWGPAAQVTASSNSAPPVSNPLALQITGQGRVTPNLNGHLLVVGSTTNITAQGTNGFQLTNWTSSVQGVLTNGANLSFIMQTGLLLTANFVDVTPPTLRVTSPGNGLTVTVPALTLRGTAADNDAVAAVWCQVGANAWTQAVGTTNWSANLTLPASTNTLRAYAVDRRGNHSATNSVTVTYRLSAPLALYSRAGWGTLSPIYTNQQMLVIGQGYRLTATANAAAGFGFWGWTGSQTNRNTTLNFRMASNLVIIANFVDIKPPLDVVTYPAVGQRVTNQTIRVLGAASDNVGVTNVWCSLNQTNWLLTQTTNQWANWFATNVVLATGTNVVRAFAGDAAGNLSATNTVKFHSPR